MANTRNKSTIYLIDHVISELPEKKLPSNIEMFQHFFYYVRGDPPKTCHDSAQEAVKNCEKIWNSIGLSTTSSINSCRKLLKMYNDWRKSCMNRKRLTEAEAKRVSKFTSIFNKRFDMGSREAMEKLHAMTEDDIKLKFQESTMKMPKMLADEGMNHFHKF